MEDTEARGVEQIKPTISQPINDGSNGTITSGPAAALPDIAAARLQLFTFRPLASASASGQRGQHKRGRPVATSASVRDAGQSAVGSCASAGTVRSSIDTGCLWYLTLSWLLWLVFNLLMLCSNA